MSKAKLHRVKRAIILAAGLGSRMLPATINVPKPLVRVNGRTLIETQLDACIQANISDITIVVGSKADQFDHLLKDYPTINFIVSPRYATTNNLVSVDLAKDLLDDAYIIEGDIFIKNPSIIREYESASNYCGIRAARVTNDWCFTVIDNYITTVKYGNTQPCYRYMGISFWTADDAQKLRRDIAQVLQNPDNEQLFFEAVPLDLYKHSYDVQIRELPKGSAIEIDTYDELKQLDKSYK